MELLFTNILNGVLSGNIPMTIGTLIVLVAMLWHSIKVQKQQIEALDLSLSGSIEAVEETVVSTTTSIQVQVHEVKSQVEHLGDEVGKLAARMEAAEVKNKDHELRLFRVESSLMKSMGKGEIVEVEEDEQ